MGKWRHLPTGMTQTMADQSTQIPAAAADTTTGQAPAVGGPSASSSSHQQETELSLAEALALDLAEPDDDEKSNEGADSTSDEEGDANGGDDNHEDDEDSDEGDNDSDDDNDGSEDDSEEDPSKDDAKDKNDEDGPKGLEELPKWAQKRIRKQSEDIRTLKGQIAQGGLTLAPTPLMPLAHVRDQEGLTHEIQTAKNIRALLGKLKDEDYEESANGLQAEVQVGQQKYVLSKAEVEAKLAHAEAVLDPETITSRQDYLRHREQYKPWEVAEQVMPGILQKDTPANKAYEHLLKVCPELPARLPDYEFIMACAVRGLSQYKEEAEGKAKWQRFVLDDKGNIVPPKRKAGEKEKSKGEKREDPAPQTPNNQRPAVRPAGGKATNADLDELQKRAEAGDEAAMRELMRAEMMS